jgi:hypothetical protein
VARADVSEVFQRVLYPLLEALIAAPGNVETTESRLRASVLLCKAFMKLEISDNVAGEDVTERWVQVLDYLGRLMSIDQSDQLVRFTFLYEKRDGTLTGESRCLVRGCARVIEKCHSRHAHGRYPCASSCR